MRPLNLLRMPSVISVHRNPHKGQEEVEGAVGEAKVEAGVGEVEAVPAVVPGYLDLVVVTTTLGVRGAKIVLEE